MKDINFEEIREQVRANLAKLVNKRNELCTRHAAMIKDLNTVRDICRTYGSPTDQSEEIGRASGRERVCMFV